MREQEVREIRFWFKRDTDSGLMEDYSTRFFRELISPTDFPKGSLAVSISSSLLPSSSMGGDLGRTGGPSPKDLRWGTAHVSAPSPNILRSTVMGCEAKYELIKKRCQGGNILV